MSHAVIKRTEMLSATLNLGGATIELADYAATGLLSVAVGPKGKGKTNAGLLMAEQLADQGWVCVLIDPEGELETMYGKAVASPEALAVALKARNQTIIVVNASDVHEFIPYGNVILEAADTHRKPLFLMVDEGQLFSTNSKRKEGQGESSALINDFVERGRKRALDMFLTAHAFTGSINRSVFRNKNLTFVGCQEDPAAWATLSLQFRHSQITYADLNALSTGEFFCLSSRGIEKIRMPMAKALAKVALPARTVKKALPSTYKQWARAMGDIPIERLEALTTPVTALLGAVAGLSAQQMLAGSQALADELECR